MNKHRKKIPRFLSLSMYCLYVQLHRQLECSLYSMILGRTSIAHKVEHLKRSIYLKLYAFTYESWGQPILFLWFLFDAIQFASDEEKLSLHHFAGPFHHPIEKIENQNSQKSASLWEEFHLKYVSILAKSFRVDYLITAAIIFKIFYQPRVIDCINVHFCLGLLINFHFISVLFSGLCI